MWQSKLYCFSRLVCSHEIFLLNIITRLTTRGISGGSDGKESACNAGDPGFSPWVRKIPWSRDWLSTPVFLLGEFHGQRSLESYSPWSLKELGTTERLTLSLSLKNRQEARVRNEEGRDLEGGQKKQTWDFIYECCLHSS